MEGGMTAAGIAAGVAPASMSAAPCLMAMAAATCASWCRRRGGRAGAWSIAVIERHRSITNDASPGAVAGAFALRRRRRFPFMQYLLEGHAFRPRRETKRAPTT